MRQEPKAPPAPIGVVYNTSMARVDAALALAALHVASSRRQARVNAVCVTGSSFEAAVFCDVVARFYTGATRAPSSNTTLPVGFSADPGARNPLLIQAAVKRTRPDGQPQYVRTIQRVSDTAAPDALLRNAVTLTAETIVILSAPATWIARSLALADTPALYRKYVKQIMVVEAGDLERDLPANEAFMKRSLRPVVSVGREVGEALSVPLDRIQNAFPSNAANPVADAVATAHEGLIQLQDVAAVHYGLHPDSGFFTLNGARLAVNPPRRDECLAALISLATSKPAGPPPRGD
ncbi:MAG TPA: hypothetical protein VH138_16390 [Vicinamibacterales bacterium]|nr:hypothetical protein [Vicinamibacterales bacterium]